MKTIILSLFILICSVFSLQAQVNYGVEIGGLSNQLNTSNVEVNPKFSYRVGGFITYDEFFGSSIYYVRKGAKLSEFIPQHAGYIQQIDYSADYIEIVPISVRITQCPCQANRKLKTSLVLSLYAAYGFSGSGTLTGIDENNSTFKHSIDNLFKDNRFIENNVNYDFKGFNAFDVGAKIGADIGYKQFILRFNWTTGAINFSSYDKRLRNGSVDISLCYLFK
ncbi:MAG: hypothetical protein LBI82_01245 [Dysgonamonadaceae bacterium]|nr:hypothetical protein [Dysgonamonadaceae bacterium]